jgi:DNA-binding transcriptional LysR family regulator
MSEAVDDLGALRALREVGRHGSIAAAAAVLGISQQALSARMRTLERATGVSLLARSPAGSHLTEQGRLIVGWAEDVLDAADRLEAGLRSIRSGVSHRLAIAASQTIAEHLVPHWLVELRGIEQASAEQAPGYAPTVVELTVANSTRVVELVRDVKVRLGFIETPHLPAGLVTAHLRDDEMLVVAAPGHPWARRRRPLPLAEIAATPLVMREAGSGTRDSPTTSPGSTRRSARGSLWNSARARRSARRSRRASGRGCSAGWPSAMTSCSAGLSPSRSPGRR